MSFTKVAPAGIGTSPGNSILIGDSLLHSTGIDIGSNTGIGVTIRKHGDATFTGIVTASAFFGDGSGLEGVSSSGIGTALNDDDTNILNKIYYVNQELSIGSTVTVNHPDTGTASYTHYQDLVVKNDADFIVADGDTFIPDILGITTSTLAASAATGGRIRAGTITNAGANGAVNFPNGLTGTAGTFTGNLNIGGVLTYEDVTNVDSVGVITARAAVSIADSIIHTGDTNTSLRFPSADTITAETGGLERLRVDSSGRLGIGANNNDSYDTNARNVLIASSGNTGITIRSGGSSNYAMVHFADGTTGAAQQRAGRIVYEHSTDSLQVSTANTFAFKIDSNGAVTKPNQPSFGAYGNASWTTINSGTGGVPVFPNATHNIGTHYNTSNGIFTAPVAGLYLLMVHVMVSTSDDSTSTDTRSFDMFFQKNSSNLARHHQKRGYKNDGDIQNTMDMTCTEVLSANDTINLYFYANSYAQRWYGAHTYFGVTLLS